MKSIRELFPLASAATVAANPQMSVPNGGSVKPYSSKMLMNKTESEFAQRLEIMKLNGEILRYEYEGVTLRWADMRYCPDFVVFDYPKTESNTDAMRQAALVSKGWARIRLVEVKGNHIWDRDIVRFKGARAYWPEFAFEMHQKTKQGWKRKY